MSSKVGVTRTSMWPRTGCPSTSPSCAFTASASWMSDSTRSAATVGNESFNQPRSRVMYVDGTRGMVTSLGETSGTSRGVAMGASASLGASAVPAVTPICRLGSGGSSRSSCARLVDEARSITSAKSAETSARAARTDTGIVGVSMPAAPPRKRRPRGFEERGSGETEDVTGAPSVEDGSGRSPCPAWRSKTRRRRALRRPAPPRTTQMRRMARISRLPAGA